MTFVGKELTMTKIYECKTCGVITQTREQVCKPQRLENMGVYCGEPGTPEQMCDEMKEHVAFVCDSCGRPAEQASMVCAPIKTG